MSEPAEIQKINRVAVSFAVGAGMAAGAAPLMVLLNSPEGWLFIALSSWAIAGLTLLFIRRPTYHKPSAGEYLLSAFDVTFIAGFLGGCGMLLYAALNGIVGGTEWLLQRFWDMSWDQVQIAAVTTLALAVAFYWIMAWTYASQVAEDMTPETAGLRSPYYFMLTVDRLYMRENLYWLLGLLVPLIVGLFYWPKGWIPLVLFQVYLFLGMTNFATTSIEERIEESSSPQQEKTGGFVAQNAFTKLASGKVGPDTRTRLYVEQVALLYRACGWIVESRPRTQNPSIDPLLVDIDLLAVKKDLGVLVDVSSSLKPKPFTDFQRPASIAQAIWSLAEASEDAGGGLGASLVLVNRPADEMIEKICSRLKINLVQLDTEDFEIFLKIPEEDLDARSLLASQMLRLEDQVAA